MTKETKEARARAEVRSEKAQRTERESEQGRLDRVTAADAVERKTAGLKALRLKKEAADAQSEAEAKPAKRPKKLSRPEPR